MKTKWPSIHLFHYTYTTMKHLADQGQKLPVVVYRDKTKIHGVNVSIINDEDGVRFYSRDGQISYPGSDLHGFARWAMNLDAEWRKLPVGTVVFGEWAGPGVERGMAISALPEKTLSVFSVVRGDTIIYEPEQIEQILSSLNLGSRVKVVSWGGDAFQVDFADVEGVSTMTDVLSRRVEAVEAEDPWVKTVYGVSGVGEGLVLYPLSVNGEPVVTLEQYALYAFKAKGEKHRTVGAKQAVQVDPTVVNNAAAFATLVVTEARLQQGAKLVDETRSPKNTGAFLAWIMADVLKETTTELAASGLTWDQVKSKVQEVARIWWLRKG